MKRNLLLLALLLCTGLARGQFTADQDGDGIPDEYDACPTKPGPIKFGGCPDSDNDGLPDHLDNCPSQYGPRSGGGCPQNTSPSATASRNRETFTVKGVSFDMIRVEGGTFTMGCTSEQGSDCFDLEKPAHQVTLSGYQLGETEVTQRLWEAVMGSNPSHFKNCPECPVEMVNWEDAQTFIQKLNSLTGRTFRLPTEAEWEYAARGGRQSRGYKYAGNNAIDEVAEYDGNNNKSTKPVKGKRPNELGFYDLSGNVLEWCQDWYGSYSSGSQTNPQGPSSGSRRVFRGGSWYSDARYARVSYRFILTPGLRGSLLGFRLARTSD